MNVVITTEMLESVKNIKVKFGSVKEAKEYVKTFKSAFRDSINIEEQKVA